MAGLYEQNIADKHLVIGSLEVIGDIKNAGMAKIQQNVNAIQQENAAFSLQQKNYWSALASDGVISAVEKKVISREFQNIQRSYAAILDQATTQKLQNTQYILDYKGAFEDLDLFLNVTLGLFDDMEVNTTLTAAQTKTYNALFDAYYYSEKFATLALTFGAMGNMGFRVLENLSEPGVEGEVGLYHGQIYQYTEGRWEAVGLEGYIGAKASLPPGTLNQYFLAIENFVTLEGFYVNGQQLIINKQELCMSKRYESGFIYLNSENGWVQVTDKTDYRYVVAMVDLVNYTGELPGVYQQAIEQGVARNPYKGKLKTVPLKNIKTGDFFVYSGASFIEIDTGKEWTNSHVYKYENNEWKHLDPANSDYSNYYMQALEDIFSMHETTDAYFAVVFARSFFGHEATLEALSVQNIFLKENGSVQSEETQYVKHEAGLRIDADGNIDANGDTYIGGNLTVACKDGKKVQIYGDVSIGSEDQPAKLDCGVMKVTQGAIKYDIALFPRAENNFYRYIFDKTGIGTSSTDEVVTLSIEQLYGKYVYLSLNDQIKIERLQLWQINNRASSGYVTGYDRYNNAYGIADMMGSMGISYRQYYDVRIYYEQYNTVFLDFANLPEQDPHIKGRAFKQGTNLCVSQG